MSAKSITSKLDFEAKVSWSHDVNGIVTSPKSSTTLEVATPSEFPGGVEGYWSPESLFLASIASCFMSTFISFANRKHLSFSDVRCEVKGKVEQPDGIFSFTHIDIFPEISIDLESDKALAEELIRRTSASCLISHSIKSEILYHSVLKINGGKHLLPEIYHHHLPVSQTHHLLMPHHN